MKQFINLTLILVCLFPALASGQTAYTSIESVAESSNGQTIYLAETPTFANFLHIESGEAAALAFDLGYNMDFMKMDTSLQDSSALLTLFKNALPTQDLVMTQGVIVISLVYEGRQLQHLNAMTADVNTFQSWVDTYMNAVIPSRTHEPSNDSRKPDLYQIGYGGSHRAQFSVGTSNGIYVLTAYPLTQ